MSTGRKRAGVLGVIFAAGVLLPAACTSPYGAEDLPPPLANPTTDASNGASADTSPPVLDGAPPLPECGAQRVVHIVAGTGGLAWFTLLWPAPLLITNPQVDYAFDDPTKAQAVAATTAAHPLYARKVGTRSLLDGLGAHPHPTVFVAGLNETHTTTPATAVTISPSTSVVAAGTAAQKTLAPNVPALAFVLTSPYGPAPAAPLSTVANIDEAVALLKTKTTLTAAREQDLRPDGAKLAAWGIEPTSPLKHVELAQRLLFTASAFRLGLIATVIIPALSDDPHGAFADVTLSAGSVADALGRILEGFYAELGKATELTCGHRGVKLSLADNVVLVVSGDTPKNAFVKNGWGDGTPGNSNTLFVRSNGFLQPGWFGQIAPAVRTNFDPATGNLATDVPNATATTGALAGVLYAISRGNAPFVSSVTQASYQGVLAPNAP